MGIFDYDATPANNTAIDGYSIAEGGPAGDLNDAIRAMAADLAQYLADSGGALDTTGSSNTYAVTTSQTWASYADGQPLVVRANHSNTDAATINVDSLGAKAIKKLTGGGVADVASGDIQADGVYPMTYDNGNGYFILVGGLGTGDFSTLSASGVASFASGTEAAPGISFTDDPDSGLYRIGANNIGMSLGGDLGASFAAGSLRINGDDTSAILSLDIAEQGLNSRDPQVRAIQTSGVGQNGLAFYVANAAVPAEAARIAHTKSLMVGKTASGIANDGVEIYATGRIDITDESNAVLFINRRTTDGNLVQFYQDETLEGNISVSGTTVTYGNFCGSHYSECATATEFLKGTIVESTGELVSDRFTTSERLVKFKVATKGSKAVYGTILGPSLEDDIKDDDGNKVEQGEGRNPVRTQYLVAGLGAYQVRMKKGQKPSVGDLVESAGGGVGAVQKDDIVTSRTVAKITGAHSVATYDDGSTVWPAVIMCG